MGRCTCKTGVAGEKCQRCLANFFEFGDNGCRFVIFPYILSDMHNNYAFLILFEHSSRGFFRVLNDSLY